MRGFLQDYRPNMVGLFKRFNGINGKAAAKSQDLLKDIVDAYVALAAMSGFVEVSGFWIQMIVIKCAD